MWFVIDKLRGVFDNPPPIDPLRPIAFLIYMVLWPLILINIINEKNE